MSTNDYMQTCNMDERTNDEKLRDTIDQQHEQIERLNQCIAAKDDALLTSEGIYYKTLDKLKAAEQHIDTLTARVAQLEQQLRESEALLAECHRIIEHDYMYGDLSRLSESDMDRRGACVEALITMLTAAPPTVAAPRADGGE